MNHTSLRSFIRTQNYRVLVCIPTNDIAGANDRFVFKF
jgi:hypothetical protein